jgi:molybdate transport system regulatory protein
LVLVDEINRLVGRPVVTTLSGGVAGGGARLTPAGEEVISLYRSMETRARDATDENFRSAQELFR